MLRVSGSPLLGSGDFRSCYQHPDDRSKCIKIQRAGPPAHRLDSVSRLLGRRAPDANRREISEYRRLQRIGAPVEQYFPAIHGIVETDLGPGLCMDIAASDDGEAPFDLGRIIAGKWPPGLRPGHVAREVRAFSDFCVRYGVLASCDEPHNLGFVRRGGEYRLIAYDLKVRLNKEFIPVASIVPLLRRKKVERRMRRSFGPLFTGLGQA